MRFTKRHTRNGRVYNPGDEWHEVTSGRFLYQRGILEENGGPNDAHITAKRPPKGMWAETTDIEEIDHGDTQ